MNGAIDYNICLTDFFPCLVKGTSDGGYAQIVSRAGTVQNYARMHMCISVNFGFSFLFTY
jgi:hypothetical protein